MKFTKKNNSRITFDNTASVMKLASQGIPAIKRGNEKQMYNIGDKVITNGRGTIKAGYGYIIQDIMENGNGYYSYYFGNMWHKLGDFERL